MKTLPYPITIGGSTLPALAPAQKQKVRATIRFVCLTVIVLAFQLPAAAQNVFTDAGAGAIQVFLRKTFTNDNAGMVIGILDARGSRVFSAGKLGNGTDREVNGDTVFEIGSVTKVFTSLLALDMAQRGEVKLDDPVGRFLPARVRVPAYEGKHITLRNLATQIRDCPGMRTTSTRFSCAIRRSLRSRNSRRRATLTRRKICMRFSRATS